MGFVNWEWGKRMTKDAVLELLREADGFVSGQQMSEKLQLTRAAVWKAIQALREDGYAIESATNRGFRLAAPTGRLCRTEKILCRGSCTTAKPVTVCIMRLRRRFCCDVLAFRHVM